MELKLLKVQAAVEHFSIKPMQLSKVLPLFFASVLLQA
jgi:hypothetical protein